MASIEFKHNGVSVRVEICVAPNGTVNTVVQLPEFPDKRNVSLLWVGKGIEVCVRPKMGKAEYWELATEIVRAIENEIAQAKNDSKHLGFKNEDFAPHTKYDGCEKFGGLR